MIVLATSLTIFTISAVLYSLCRIPSRAWSPVRDKSLIIDNVEDSGRLRELLANGDTESVHRILKSLQQRGDVDLIETENEIYVTGHQGVSAGKGRKITRGLLVSGYDPIEDFRNLRAAARVHPGARAVNTIRDIIVGKYEKVIAADREASNDHLFASDYDVREILENLTARSGGILAASGTA